MSHKKRLENFINHNGIVKTEDGRLVLYKAVRGDYGSIYAWPYQNYSPVNDSCDNGAYRPRNTVVASVFNTDPKEECGAGLHASTLSFAEEFASWEGTGYDPKIIEVLVDPRDVVCVPYCVPYAHPGRSAPEKIRCRKLYVKRVVKHKV